MKLKNIGLLLAVLIPSYFVFAPDRGRVPSDLRDAVSDGAFESLAGARGGGEVPEVPVPVAEELFSASKSIYGADDRLD
ncbi:MAG TPA: hypothetical protein DCZ93_02985, partial [Elusimicrobia bacterium]|nr:hypothetical protein [Elusimicrobiota bacterium]